MEVIQAIVEALDKGMKAGAYSFQENTKFISAIQHIERELQELNQIRSSKEAPEQKLKKS